MKLRDWRLQKGFSLGEVARQTGAKNATAVRRWETGETVPRAANMGRIYLISGGLVDPNSFYELPKVPKRRAA